MECPACKFAIPGEGFGVVEGECPSCGYRPERDQPGGVASDGRLRNMVDPGSGQDMGGNPLQEGILGDWQNRTVRDESFASVRTALHGREPHPTHPRPIPEGFEFSPRTQQGWLPQTDAPYLPPNATPEQTEEWQQLYKEWLENVHNPAHEQFEIEYAKNPSAWGSLTEEGFDIPDRHVLAWNPGSRGRGILIDDKLHTWPVRPTEENPKGGYMHFEYLNRFKPATTFSSGFEIEPDGSMIGGDDAHAQAIEADPRLKPGAGGTGAEIFNFARAQPVTSDMSANWEHERLSLSLHTPWTHRTAASIQVLPEPQHGIHNGVCKALSFLDASVNGLSTRSQSRDVVGTYSPFNQQGWAETSQQPVQIDVPYDEYIPAVRDIVEAGREFPMNPGPELKTLVQRMKAGEVPFPPGINPDQVRASVQAAAMRKEAVIWGAAARLIASPTGRGLINQAVSKGKGVLPAGLGGAAKKAVGFAGKASLLHNVGKLLGGGGQQQVPAQPPATRTYEQLSHIAHWVLSDLETPSSVPSIGTGGDPEQVDPHEFDDGVGTSNLYDPALPEGGSVSGDKKLDLFVDALPELLEYYESEESGLQNPKIRQLYEMLQAEEDSAKLGAGPSLPPNALPPNAMAPGQPPGGIHPVQSPGLQGETPGQGRCPSCGGVLAANGLCPQCGAAGPPPSGPALGAPGVPQQGIGQLQQTGLVPGVTAAHEHQGPRNSEQFAAVAELLTEQGREDEIVAMLQTPWEYADELAEVQHKQAPPIDQSQPEPQPAQEEAPPGDTIPVPVPQPPQQLAAALEKVGADNVAPRCPRCDSATTKLLNSDGDCQCHRCGKGWKMDTDIAKNETVSKVATPREFAPEHSDLHIEKEVPVNLPAADQDSPDTDEHDTSRVWATTDGEPLRVGDVYEMTSAQYSVPDIVKVNAVKPDSVDLTIVGEYSARGDEDAELSYRHEIPREEAQIERYEFKPIDLPDGDEPEAEGHEHPGYPTPAPGEVSDLSRPHSSSLSEADVQRIATALAEKIGTVPEFVQQNRMGIPVQKQYDSSDDYWKEPQDRGWAQSIEQEGTVDTGEDASWAPGGWGRGAILADGSVLTWPEEAGTHEEVVERKQLQPKKFFTISPDGELKPYSWEGSGTFDDEDIAVITQSNPALRGPETTESGEEVFNFSHVADTHEQATAEVDPERAWLLEGTRLAGAKFSPPEQREFIEEDGEARNSDRLNLQGTHYETRYDAKARPEEVPSEHLVFGL